MDWCDPRACSKVIRPDFERVVPLAGTGGRRGSFGASVSLSRSRRLSLRIAANNSARDKPTPASRQTAINTHGRRQDRDRRTHPAVVGRTE